MYEDVVMGTKKVDDHDEEGRRSRRRSSAGQEVLKWKRNFHFINPFIFLPDS